MKDGEDQLVQGAVSGFSKMDPKLGSFAFKCYALTFFVCVMLCIFEREGKHLSFCEQEV